MKGSPRWKTLASGGGGSRRPGWPGRRIAGPERRQEMTGSPLDTANASWGYQRIQGELLKLGHRALACRWQGRGHAARWPSWLAPPWSAWSRSTTSNGRRHPVVAQPPCRRRSLTKRAEVPPGRGPRARLAPGAAAKNHPQLAVQVHRVPSRGRYPMMSRCSEPSALSVQPGGGAGACARLTVPGGLIRPRAIGGAAR